MIKRSIKKIMFSKKINMGGYLLDQPLPIWESIKLIHLLMHHWDEPVPKAKQEQLALDRIHTEVFSCHLYIQRKLKSSRFHWEPQRS